MGHSYFKVIFVDRFILLDLIKIMYWKEERVFGPGSDCIPYDTVFVILRVSW